MKNKRLLSFLAIFISLAGIVLYLSNRNETVGVGEGVSADTLFVVKTDTIIERDTTVIYKERKVVDTVYIETHEKPVLSFPVVQKHFSRPNYYDLWISGLEPLKMDSLKIYQRTEYKYVTNLVEKPTYKEQYKLYAGGGLFSFRETLTPYVGVSLSAPQKWLISANFGLNGYLGFELKYNIFSYDKR